MEYRFRRIIKKISKFTTYRNRLKRMKDMLDLTSEHDAARLVMHRHQWFDHQFVDFCRSLTK